MIRHTILFKLKVDVPKSEVEEVFSDILNLAGSLSGIVSIEGGSCSFQKDASGNRYSHGVSIDFEDSQAFQLFLADPSTHHVRDRIDGMSEGGHQNVMEFQFGLKQAR